jgi:hypothetical protein
MEPSWLTAHPTGNHRSLNGLRISIMRAIAIVSLSSVLHATSLAAQAPVQPHHSAPWGLITGIGFSGLGAAAVFPVAWSASMSDGISMFLVGALTGMVVGGVVGHRASSHINNGKPVRAAHKVAVGIGTVAAGAVFGALGAIPLINNEESRTVLGSDEQTLALTVTGGVLLGATYWAFRQRQFTSRTAIVVRPAGRGVGVGVRAAFR